MKTLKKLMAVTLVFAMIMSLTVVTFAAKGSGDNPTPDSNPPAVNSDSSPATKGTGNFTVTIDDAEQGHTFKAYQIFAGSVDSAGKLSDIEWATGVDKNGVKSGIDALNILPQSDGTTVYDYSNAAVLADQLGAAKDTLTATQMADIARVFYNNKGDAAKTVNAMSGTDYKLTGLKAGYYLITDEYTNGAPASDAGAATLSRNMLTVVADVTAHAKNDVPTVEKKILTPTPAETNTAGVGDTVAFQITGAVPNYTGHEKYYYVINDKLSDGLTFDGAQNVVVKVGSTVLSSGQYEVSTTNDTNYTFQVGFKNIMGFTIGDPITVTYSATVNENAVIGSDGNPNTTDVQFSNNPNSDGNGNPGTNPFPGRDVPTGKSTESKTITYVAEVDLTKYADEVAAGKELAGATFTLTGTVTKVVGSGGDIYTADANGAYWKLKSDGGYTTTAPHGDILDANGNVKVESNYKYYDSTTQKYTLQHVTNYTNKTEDVLLSGTTDANGKLIFKGLGAGTYTLTEVAAPNGFNTAAPITFTIGATLPTEVVSGNEKATWTVSGDGVSLKDNVATCGIYVTNVVDKSGTELPSTGGIGTKIFYALGAVLVIGAGVVLVSRKRALD